MGSDEDDFVEVEIGNAAKGGPLAHSILSSTMRVGSSSRHNGFPPLAIKDNAAVDYFQSVDTANKGFNSTNTSTGNTNNTPSVLLTGHEGAVSHLVKLCPQYDTIDQSSNFIVSAGTDSTMIAPVPYGST